LKDIISFSYFSDILYFSMCTSLISKKTKETKECYKQISFLNKLNVFMIWSSKYNNLMSFETLVYVTKEE